MFFVSWCSVNAETVPEWLEALDLGQYESSLMANGFDDIRYLVSLPFHFVVNTPSDDVKTTMLT